MNMKDFGFSRVQEGSCVSAESVLVWHFPNATILFGFIISAVGFFTVSFSYPTSASAMVSFSSHPVSVWQDDALQRVPNRMDTVTVTDDGQSFSQIFSRNAACGEKHTVLEPDEEGSENIWMKKRKDAIVEKTAYYRFSSSVPMPDKFICVSGGDGCAVDCSYESADRRLATVRIRD
ncbi:MAG: hypothetical protein WCJ25_00555 [Candidatus Moraniibacteriota bacterium]